jgi:hypothetical protein
MEGRLARSQGRQTGVSADTLCPQSSGHAGIISPTRAVKGECHLQRAILSSTQHAGTGGVAPRVRGRPMRHAWGVSTHRARSERYHAAGQLATLTAFVIEGKRRHNVLSPARPAGLLNSFAYA